MRTDIYNGDKKTKTIILINCGAKKRKCSAKARDLYVGGYFKKTLLYAEYLSNKNNAEILLNPAM